jgi:multiple antibiotic resistance protein
MIILFSNPAANALNELGKVPWVRFALLALSSIFFLVDPFAAIGSFLAITAGADATRRKRMARKGALTCFIVLTSFALCGQVIFRMFGITLPAFEIAGGLILLLIGLDMLEAKRSPTQEASGDTEEASHKEDAGIVPLGIPMLAGPGAISSVMVLVGQVHSILQWEMGAIVGDQLDQLLGLVGRRQGAHRSRRDRHPHPGAHYGPAAGGAGHAVLRKWADGPGRDSKAVMRGGAWTISTGSAAFPQAKGLRSGGIVAILGKLQQGLRGFVNAWLQTRAACATL